MTSSSDVTRDILPDPRTLTSLERMTIEHGTGQYMLNDAPVQISELDRVIMLGAVRQRVMWTPREEPGGGMECKSYDFEHGKPTPLFPTIESNFPADGIANAQTKAEHSLACGACVFKDWKHDPAERRGTKHPRCTVQIAVPLLVIDTFSNQYVAAVATYQRSAERPITDYMKTFTKKNKPAYTQITRLRLNRNLGSGFDYSTPTFTEMATVDEEYHPMLSLLYRTARGIIKTPPPPRPSRTGGMLSVSTAEAVAPPTYTGGFFR